ncbi:MAG: HNH endonuclease [bacterium ADurb.Bin236]|nr:MAG: HNH endonuclease [bacterium ADurb.Bin236]
MNKRRQLNRRERESVFRKCGGRCAYCGCELSYKEMTVDHVEPLHQGGKDELENMLPACRSCNHRKSSSTVESYRRQVESFLKVLERDSVTYRNAVRFGLIIPNPHRVKFYFEEQNEEGSK